MINLNKFLLVIPLLLIFVVIISGMGYAYADSHIVPKVQSSESLQGTAHGFEIELMFSNGIVYGSIISDEYVINIDNIKVIEKHDRFYIFDKQNDLKIFSKQLTDEKYLVIIKINSDSLQTNLRFLANVDNINKNTHQRDLFAELEAKQNEEPKSDNLTFRELQLLEKQSKIDIALKKFEDAVKKIEEYSLTQPHGNKTKSSILEEYEQFKIKTGMDLVIVNSTKDSPKEEIIQYIPELAIVAGHDFKTFWKETFNVDVVTYDLNKNKYPDRYPFEGRIDGVDVNVILSLDDNKVAILSGVTQYGQWQGEYFFQDNSPPGEYVVDVIASYLGKTVSKTSPMFVVGTVVNSGGSSANVAPVANAGVDQLLIVHLTTVMLDGSASLDSDGTIASYSWTQTNGPPTVTINNPNTATPDFDTLGAGETYTFELTVTDNKGVGSIDAVTVTTT